MAAGGACPYPRNLGPEPTGPSKGRAAVPQYVPNGWPFDVHADPPISDPSPSCSATRPYAYCTCAAVRRRPNGRRRRRQRLRGGQRKRPRRWRLHGRQRMQRPPLPPPIQQPLPPVALSGSWVGRALSLVATSRATSTLWGGMSGDPQMVHLYHPSLSTLVLKVVTSGCRCVCVCPWALGREIIAFVELSPFA